MTSLQKNYTDKINFIHKFLHLYKISYKAGEFPSELINDIDEIDVDMKEKCNVFICEIDMTNLSNYMKTQLENTFLSL
jgi:hypothetical protein